jgi:hypothetical protein
MPVARCLPVLRRGLLYPIPLPGNNRDVYPLIAGQHASDRYRRFARDTADSDHVIRRWIATFSCVERRGAVRFVGQRAPGSFG